MPLKLGLEGDHASSGLWAAFASQQVYIADEADSLHGHVLSLMPWQPRRHAHAQGCLLMSRDVHRANMRAMHDSHLADMHQGRQGIQLWAAAAGRERGSSMGRADTQQTCTRAGKASSSGLQQLADSGVQARGGQTPSNHAPGQAGHPALGCSSWRKVGTKHGEGRHPATMHQGRQGIQL